ncbi:MAG: hypothetical protein OXU96_04000 [Gammaproteobacteria bacterium]|nr:hypothetical protein [Gammaproteobacteria bacterium]
MRNPLIFREESPYFSRSHFGTPIPAASGACFPSNRLSANHRAASHYPQARELHSVIYSNHWRGYGGLGTWFIVGA